MTDIKSRLEKHYNYAVEHYGKETILGVFCYGPWNYNTNAEDTKINTICILIPNIYSLAIRPYGVKHLHLDKEEVCECITIMEAVKNWRKQIPEFIEIMFTDYRIINPVYQQLWNEFTLDDKELIAHYDVEKFIQQMGGQALNLLKKDPENLERIMEATRICNSLTLLMKNISIPYKQLIKATPEIANIKNGKMLFSESFLGDLQENIETFIKIAPQYDKYSTKKNLYVNERLEVLIIQLISHRIKNL